MLRQESEILATVRDLHSRIQRNRRLWYALGRLASSASRGPAGQRCRLHIQQRWHLLQDNSSWPLQEIHARA